jgi:hypothetical protein
MEVVSTSETSLNFCEITRRSVSEDACAVVRTSSHVAVVSFQMLRLSVYQEVSSRYRGVRTAFLYIMLDLGVCGAFLPLPHMLSWGCAYLHHSLCLRHMELWSSAGSITDVSFALEVMKHPFMRGVGLYVETFRKQPMHL